MIAAISLVYFLRQAYRHVRSCIENEMVVKQVKKLAVYSVSEVKELLQKFVNMHVTVLELAATVDWLWRHEKPRFGSNAEADLFGGGRAG